MQIYFVFGIILAVAALLIVGANVLVRKGSEGRVYYSVDSVPGFRVGLVLGCVPYLADGRENLFFKYRIRAAEELFGAGKVDYLLVSGDNSRKGYDEPTAMRDALVGLGVPSDRIVLDYAGFSTLDSMVRANRVFGQTDVVVISQEFHVRRAIYIANARGLTASGYVARDVTRSVGFKTHAREHLAKVRAVLDVNVFMRQPKFLGELVRIGDESR
jgi:SanA protein